MAQSRRSVRFIVPAILLVIVWTSGFAAPTVQAAGPVPVTYTYDANGRLSGVIDPSAGSAAYSYDSAGNVTSITRRAIGVATVLEVTPDRGAVGAQVTIEGTAFSATIAQDTVKFNGVTATIVSATTTKLVATVPAGATTGPVSVTSPAGTAASPTSFAVGSLAPTITGFTPSVAAAGDTLTVTGTNFETLKPRDVLAVSGIREAIATASPTSLTAPIVGSGSGKVQVVTAAGVATSSSYLYTVPCCFTAAEVESTGVLTVGTAQTTMVGSLKIALRVFEGVAGEHLSLTIPGLGSSVAAKIYRPDGVMHAGFDSGPAFVDIPALPVTGTYTVFLRNTNGTPQGGSLLVSDVAPDVTGTIPVNAGGLPVTIGTPGQNARLTFQATAGERVVVSTSNGSVSSKLTLLSPDDIPLGVSATPGLAPFIEAVTLPVAGTYTILMDPLFAATGQLTVAVNDDLGDLPLPLTIGTVTNLPTFAPGQNIAATFAGTAGARVSIDVNTFGAFSTIITVRNPDGSTLESQQAWGWFFDPIVLPTTGTYTIYIDPYSQNTGPGTVAVYSVPPDSMGTIVVGGPAVAVPLAPGQKGTLTFSGSTDQVISLASTGATSSSIDLVISDPTGNGIVTMYSISLPFVVPTTLPSTGTYTITVDPVGANISDYSFQLYQVPPDDVGTMTIGGPSVTVTNTAPGQNMSRTFTGTAGQLISLDVKEVTATHPRGLVMVAKLLSPTGTTLWGPIQFWQPMTEGFLEPLVLPSTGTYTVSIDPNYETLSTYRLQAFAVLPDATGTITVGGAAVVATNTTPGQNMRKTFACTNGQKVKLISNNATLTGANINILNASGSGANGTYVDFTSTPSNTLTATISGAGTCTILVDPDLAQTGSVTLTLTLNTGGAAAGSAGDTDAGAAASPAKRPSATPSPAPTPAATPTPAAAPTIAPGGTDPQPVTGSESLADHWTPTTAERRSDWRVGLPPSASETIPPLSAKKGVTALAGRVLTLDGRPLAAVTLELNSHTTTTDAKGRFLLTGIEPGPQVLLIDGSTANRPNHAYGLFEVGVPVVPKVTNNLTYTIWMTALDTDNEVSIPEPTTAETVVTTPSIPGLEVHIPAGSRITSEDGEPVTKIGLTAIPLDRPPFPLPVNTEVPIYFTIQPGLAYVAPRGAWIVYPNYNNLAPGTRTNFWQYDPDSKGWFIYGHGTVSPDGRQVVPDPRVRIYEFTGAMFTSGENPPGTGPAADGDSKDGDPVDLGTGLFVLSKTDLIEPGPLPISLTRTYRPNDSQQRAFGNGTNFSLGFFLSSAQQYAEVDLVLPDGGKVHYVRTSPGTGWTDAIFRTTATPGAYFGSSVYWNGNGWDLRLRDGTVYVFGENAPLQSIRDRFGNSITLIRSGLYTGRIDRIVGSSGRWINLGYDGNNRISSATDQAGRTIGYTYNAAGYLWKVTDPNGGVTEYTYDASNRMRTLKDARGITFLTNDYDASGRVQTQTQADGTTYQFAYVVDGAGKVTQTDVTDPRGIVRRVTFNAAGYPLTDTAAFGTPLARTTTYVRQASGNLATSVTDPLGRRTDFAYDLAGNATSTTRLAGTGNAVTTTATFEPRFGLIRTMTDPLGHAVTTTYYANGSIQKVTDAAGKDTTFTATGSGQPVSATDATGKSGTTTYLMGDVSGQVDALGNVSSRFVDAAGREAGKVDSLGALARVDYDPNGRPLTMTDPQGGTTTFTYDANGNVLTTTDPHGGVETSTFDSMDRPATREDALHRSESFTYDQVGHPATITDRNGKLTQFTYDALGRQTFVGYGAVVVGGSTSYESSVTSSYDAGDRLLSTVDTASGTITYGYDLLDRLTSETSPQGGLTYAYDNAGRRIRMTLAGQPDVIYAYDNVDRLTGVTQATDVASFTYDDAGRRLTMTIPGSIVATYGYDNSSHVTSIVYKKGTTTIGDLTYTYNADGRRSVLGGSLAGTVLPAALAAATYDAANELKTWDATTLTYDNAGNMIGRTASVTPDTQAPTVPATPIATAVGPKKVNLTWTGSSDNVAVTRYTIYRGGVALISVPGTVTSFTDWSASPSTAYTYTIAASDAAANASAQSVAANATTPAAGVTYASDAFNRTVSGGWGSADVGGAWSGTDATFSVAPGSGKITLSSATNKNANLTSVSARDQEVLFKLNVNKFATGGDTIAWVALRRQSSSTFYSARIAFKASKAIGLSFVRTSNNTATTIGSGTASPTHVLADSYWLRVQISGTTATNGKMRLWKDGTTEPTTWTVNSTDNSTPTALRGNGHIGVRFQITGTGPFPAVAAFSSFTDTTIGGGAPPVDTTVPSVPGGLTATAISAGQVNLSWTASTDNVGVQGYRIYRNGSLVATSGAPSWSDTGLTASTAYSYAVSAIDGASNASAQSSPASATTTAGSGNLTYVWNARNELSQIKTGSTVTASFTYDATGRRTSKTLGSATTGFAYGGANAIQETSGGSPTANLLTGGTDQVFRRADSVGTRYPLTDALGSVVALADSTGAIKSSYTYGPYGQTSPAGEANANPTQFTGRENDGTGLYFYRARYYDPTFGRFISEDPEGLSAGDPNLYRYVGDDPTNAVDPSGRFLDSVIDAAFIAFDLWNLATGSRKDRDANLQALGLDVLGLLIPGVTGLGIATKFAREAGHAAEITEGVYKVMTKSGKWYVGQSSRHHAAAVAAHRGPVRWKDHTRGDGQGRAIRGPRRQDGEGNRRTAQDRRARPRESRKRAESYRSGQGGTQTDVEGAGRVRGIPPMVGLPPPVTVKVSTDDLGPIAQVFGTWSKSDADAVRASGVRRLEVSVRDNDVDFLGDLDDIDEVQVTGHLSMSDVGVVRPAESGAFSGYIRTQGSRSTSAPSSRSNDSLSTGDRGVIQLSVAQRW